MKSVEERVRRHFEKHEHARNGTVSMEEAYKMRRAFAGRTIPGFAAKKVIVAWLFTFLNSKNMHCWYIAFTESVDLNPVNCQLSRWSQWSACTTPCGVNGTSSSYRYRIATEQRGGTCTTPFRKTKACPQLSCLNGGSLQNKTCLCREEYSGVCCEEQSIYFLIVCIHKQIIPYIPIVTTV